MSTSMERLGNLLQYAEKRNMRMVGVSTSDLKNLLYGEAVTDEPVSEPTEAKKEEE